MHRFGLIALAAATLSQATPSFAASPYYDAPPALLPEPPAVLPRVAPNPTNPGMFYVQPYGAGQYDCQRGEKRTRIQRRSCGPMKPDY